MPEKTEEKTVFEVEVTRKVTLTQQDIDDLMTTALEGGIDYWCRKAMALTPLSEGAEWLSEVIRRGGTVRLVTVERENKDIDLPKFPEGFKKWLEEGGSEDPADIDADCADQIVQLAVSGRSCTDDRVRALHAGGAEDG
ncbi:MAG: hypothetical protein ACYC9Q_09185 [Bacillota bacterium]